MNKLILNLESNKHFFSLHQELRNIILYNIKKSNTLKNRAIQITGKESIDELLSHGFAWQNTDVGGDFWCHVYDHAQYFQVGDDS